MTDMKRVLPALKYAAAGVLATLAGMSAGHLVASALNPASSPVLAVGSTVIDLTPTPMKEWAVREFGTKDKPILIGSVMLATLLLTAVAGVIARRRFPVGAAILALLVAVSGVLALLRPFALAHRRDSRDRRGGRRRRRARTAGAPDAALGRAGGAGSRDAPFVATTVAPRPATRQPGTSAVSKTATEISDDGKDRLLLSGDQRAHGHGPGDVSRRTVLVTSALVAVLVRRHGLARPAPRRASAPVPRTWTCPSAADKAEPLAPGPGEQDQGHLEVPDAQQGLLPRGREPHRAR